MLFLLWLCSNDRIYRMLLLWLGHPYPNRAGLCHYHPYKSSFHLYTQLLGKNLTLISKYFFLLYHTAYTIALKMGQNSVWPISKSLLLHHIRKLALGVNVKRTRFYAVIGFFVIIPTVCKSTFK